MFSGNLASLSTRRLLILKRILALHDSWFRGIPIRPRIFLERLVQTREITGSSPVMAIYIHHLRAIKADIAHPFATHIALLGES